MNFSEKGIVDSTSSGKTYMEWSTIKNLEENENYFYVYSSPTTAYILPKRAVTSVEKTRDYIQSRIHM
nr:YcxB family protein [Sporosarcina jiandibaonis]